MLAGGVRTIGLSFPIWIGAPITPLLSERNTRKKHGQAEENRTSYFRPTYRRIIWLGAGSPDLESWADFFHTEVHGGVHII